MCTLLSVEQTAQEIPALTESAIRWHLFNRHTNGLSKSGAAFNVGRRVFIDLAIFVEWLKSREKHQ
jgi:hypothetical protein